jgi:hypothetical protein
MRKQFFAALEKIDSAADHAFKIEGGLMEVVVSRVVCNA